MIFFDTDIYIDILQKRTHYIPLLRRFHLKRMISKKIKNFFKLSFKMTTIRYYSLSIYNF